MLIDSAVFAAGTGADEVPGRACRQVRTVGSSARYRWLKAMGRIAGVWALSCALPGVPAAHHSLSEWDPNVIVELQGEVVEVVWRNPHVRFTMKVENAEGEEELWGIAGSSLAHLDRRKVPRDAVEVGDIIRLSGSPSNRRRNNVIAHTMLLADGRELLIRGMGSLGPNVGSIYSDVIVGENSDWTEATEVPEGAGIFLPWRIGRPRGWDELPLTAAAESVQAQWDPRDNWVLDCEPRGMPGTMFNPYPVEFAQLDDGNILLRIEEHDNERLIHMSGDIGPATRPASRLGFSVGHWEDERTLVVETSRISFGWFNQDGIPQSEDSTIVERFELNETGDGIAYRITLTDPETFTTPVTGRAQWVAVTGIRIRPFAMYCEDGFYDD